MIKTIIPFCRICLLPAFSLTWLKLQLLDTKKRKVHLSWSVSSGECTSPLHLSCSSAVQKFCHHTPKISLPALQLAAANLSKTSGFANGLFESLTFNISLSHNIPSCIPVNLMQSPSFVPFHPTTHTGRWFSPAPWGQCHSQPLGLRLPCDTLRRHQVRGSCLLGLFWNHHVLITIFGILCVHGYNHLVT